MFQQNQTSLTKDVTPTLPNTNQPFSITADTYVFALGCVMFQTKKKENWMFFHTILVFLQLMEKNSVPLIVN